MEEGVKKGNTPMECDLKGLFKITVEETKLKEKYTIFSIWKKVFSASILSVSVSVSIGSLSASFKNSLI